jgi:hypothetical protein
MYIHLNRIFWVHHLAGVVSPGSSSNPFSATFWGAFLGAGFVFCFGLLARWIGKQQDRFAQHRSAFVKLESSLQVHLDQIVIWIATIIDTRQVLQKRYFTSRRLPAFRLYPDLMFELGNLDMINKYFGYTRFIERINGDADAFNSTLTRLEDVLIGGQVLKDENFDFLIAGLGELTGTLNLLEPQALRLLAEVRIYMRKVSALNIFFYPLFHKNWDLPISEKEIQDELKIINTEFERVKAQTDKL